MSPSIYHDHIFLAKILHYKMLNLLRTLTMIYLIICWKSMKFYGDIKSMKYTLSNSHYDLLDCKTFECSICLRRQKTKIAHNPLMGFSWITKKWCNFASLNMEEDIG
ncbi:hypothetical protein Lal_00006238 [Lupinus albus]|nr:hypothetical protein Lal_00006238 [Lupinus albus]